MSKDENTHVHHVIYYASINYGMLWIGVMLILFRLLAS